MKAASSNNIQCELGVCGNFVLLVLPRWHCERMRAAGGWAAGASDRGRWSMPT